ncbi:MAG: redoxin domain-containing protein [Ginsengibacter sp.]
MVHITIALFIMKNYLFIIILFCLPFVVLSQKQAYLITIDELNNRIDKGTDTTYIINFWATWCAPCIKELSHFEKLGQQLKTEKLKVLLISVDFKSQLVSSVIPFIKRKKLKSEVFLLDEENQQEFIERIDTSWSGSIPATLFVKNNRRKFIEKDLTYDELAEEYKSFN